jgi:ceramide glucosyltransferase
LGSTMALRRTDLEAIGRFESLVDYLADDYELGARIAQLGREIVVSDVVVDHHLPAYSLREFFDHQLRWARAIRDSRRLDYLGLGFTFGLPWALLAVLLSTGAWWSWWLLAGVFILRMAMAHQVGWRVLRDIQLKRDMWLLPFRDLLATIVWFVSFAGHSINWRGERFLLRKGKLIRS